MNENALLVLMKETALNNENSFRQLIEASQSKVYSIAFRMLCNEEDAKDVVQETFIRIWMYRSSFKESQNFSSWMYKIATNLCLDKLKQRKNNAVGIRAEETLKACLSSVDIEKALIDSELKEIILGLTQGLTPKQKLVFTLKDLEGFEVDEIANITNLTPNKIKSNLYLARLYLRRKLEKL